MNKFNIFVILSIIATATLVGGAMTSSAFAMNHTTGTMSSDNMSMPMDNSTGMTDNATMTVTP